MKQADRTQDCVISQRVHIWLTPLKPVMEGDRDEAVCVAGEVGKGLIAEALKVLQLAAEREGFKVTIDVGQVTY